MSTHPFLYPNEILDAEALSAHYHRDVDSLRAQLLALVAEVNSADEADLKLLLARLHVTSGLYDSCANCGSAAGLVSDLINV